MAIILNFPEKMGEKMAEKITHPVRTPESLQQTIFWDEWESAVVILRRKDEVMVATASLDFEGTNFLLDLAKRWIWETRETE